MFLNSAVCPEQQTNRANDFQKEQVKEQAKDQLSIRHEIDLVRDIRDVLDELNMISSVIADQKPVMVDFAKAVLKTDYAKLLENQEPGPLEYVEKIEELVKKMQENATREYAEVRHPKSTIVANMGCRWN
jgi:hypothetical protein